MAGSILLDNPTNKGSQRKDNDLTFVATFGDNSRILLGETMSADSGIAGHVYCTGRVYLASKVSTDEYFLPFLDNQSGFETEAIVAVPIRIGEEVCGVLELLNRLEQDGFTERDRDLLEIFAGYIAISIQNVLDARSAREMARRDDLTGLFNDRFLHLALDQEVFQAVEQNLDLSLIFLDLDLFKGINDSHGHLAGSQMLLEVARLISEVLVDTPSIAARYGGDEFVVVLPGAGALKTISIAEKIRRRIENHVFLGGGGQIEKNALNVTGQTSSLGVASLRKHVSEDIALENIKPALLRLADTAMYVSKETGRNRTSVASEPIPRTD